MQLFCFVPFIFVVFFCTSVHFQVIWQKIDAIAHASITELLFCVDHEQWMKLHAKFNTKFQLLLFSLFYSHFQKSMLPRCEINRIHLHYFLVCLPEMKWKKKKNNSSIRMFGLSVLNVPMIYGPNEKILWILETEKDSNFKQIYSSLLTWLLLKNMCVAKINHLSS